jgi:hypothetical protein
MLPLLIPNPSLIAPQSQTRHAQKNRKEHPCNSRHHDISSTTLPLEPLFEASRRRVRQLVIQVREPRAEIVIRNDLLLGVADRGRVVAQDVGVEVTGCAGG